MSDHGNLRRPALPPLAKVASALEEITERFAHEVFSPTGAPPQWSDSEWRIASAVAAMQGVSSLLFAYLRWSGPPHWNLFLETQREHIAARYLKIERLLESIDAHARRAGVALVALKGAALLRSGIYAGAERPMADIDLLVRDADVPQATRVLEDCGFAMTFRTWRHQLFEPRDKGTANLAGLGEHAENPLKIELHTKICELLPVSEVDITSFVFPADPRAGLNDYPSSASLMMHLLLHAAGNMRAHALRLIQLCDIVRLAERFRPNDWAELLDARSNGRDLWWAMAPLALTARYHPGAIPPLVIEQLSARCPWMLRRLSRRQRLTDVSWSNIRIYALPGLEWCSSPQEAVRFVISRAWPSRQTRTELRRFAAHQVGAGEIPWYGLSQGRRILRWVFSKPPRVQALLPIRAALAASDKQANTAELSSAAVTPRS